MLAKPPRYTLTEAFDIAGSRLHPDWVGFGKPDFFVEAQARDWPKTQSPSKKKNKHPRSKNKHPKNKNKHRAAIPKNRLKEWADAGWDEGAAFKRRTETENFLRSLIARYRISAWLIESQGEQKVVPENWRIDLQTHLWLNFAAGLAGYQNEHSGLSGPEGFLEVSREEFDNALDDRLASVRPRPKGSGKNGGTKLSTIEGRKRDHDAVDHWLKTLGPGTTIKNAAKQAEQELGRKWSSIARGRRRYLEHRAAKRQK